MTHIPIPEIRKQLTATLRELDAHQIQDELLDLLEAERLGGSHTAAEVEHLITTERVPAQHLVEVVVSLLDDSGLLTWHAETQV